jgi:hypothetical protein
VRSLGGTRRPAIESAFVPTPSRALTGVPLSRRAVLGTVAAVAGAALAGCTPERQRRRGEDPPEPVEPRVDPDVLVAAEALGNQQQMLDLLDATQQRHPRLTRQLAPVVAAHEAHAALLAEAVPADVSASPSTSPAPSPDGSATVPRKRRQALARVVAAERELATATKRHAFRAQSGAFARLLGSMAAAAAQHEVVLSTAGRRGAS